MPQAASLILLIQLLLPSLRKQIPSVCSSPGLAGRSGSSSEGRFSLDRLVGITLGATEILILLLALWQDLLLWTREGLVLQDAVGEGIRMGLVTIL